jgi:hypothetical protein
MYRQSLSPTTEITLVRGGGGESSQSVLSSTEAKLMNENFVEVSGHNLDSSQY